MQLAVETAKEATLGTASIALHYYLSCSAGLSYLHWNSFEQQLSIGIWCFTNVERLFIIIYFQGFEGSIVGENFSLSDPSSNNPLVHGGFDSGGGLISFHSVSDN